MSERPPRFFVSVGDALAGHAFAFFLAEVMLRMRFSGVAWDAGDVVGDLALEDRVDAVGDAEQFGQLARDEDDALPLRCEVLDDRVDLVLRAHVDAARGLVEDQQVGVGEHPLREDDLLLVAARELGDAGLDVGGS